MIASLEAAKVSEADFSAADPNTTDILVKHILDVFNATSLTAQQAKDILAHLQILIKLGKGRARENNALTIMETRHRLRLPLHRPMNFNWHELIGEVAAYHPATPYVDLLVPFYWPWFSRQQRRILYACL